MDWQTEEQWGLLYGRRFWAGPRADMTCIQVPDYLKRPSQVEATGSSYLPSCVLEVLKTKEKVALMENCTPFQFNHVLLRLCIGSGSLVFWLGNHHYRFFSLSALPTDVFTSRGLINALYIGLLLYNKGLLLWLAIKGGWGLEAGG